ncbi:hypothetical protein APHAL10511_006635 [Amanita phalloides]|nr:hypothetical protein APHAL10511_006635 [Amanita phalloides]
MSNSETSSTEAKTSSPGPSATDRATAKMPQNPISLPPVFHGSQSPSPDMGSLLPAPWPASVSATPSLINALHRVAAAQSRAYGVHTASDNHGMEKPQQAVVVETGFGVDLVQGKPTEMVPKWVGRILGEMSNPESVVTISAYLRSDMHCSDSWAVTSSQSNNR